MTTKKQTGGAQTPKMQVRNSPDFRSLYVNWVQTAVSPMDISMVVGEASPIGSGSFEVEQKARLMLSPLEAKIIVAMLLTAVKGYETQYGEIRVPESLAAQMGQALGGASKGSGGRQQTEGD